MPIVNRAQMKSQQCDLDQIVQQLITLTEMRPVEEGEGCKPGIDWPDRKSLGSTRGTEADIRVCADKLIAVARGIGRTKSLPGPPRRTNSRKSRSFCRDR